MNNKKTNNKNNKKKQYKFKISHFCNEHNLEFKKYYDYLNNPIYVNLLLQTLKYINTDYMKKKMLQKIIDNHSIILEKIKIANIVILFYKKNNLINKSEIGKFFNFYEKYLKKTNVNNYNDLLKLFYKLIHYENLISVLKECFYIFSDYRACIYHLTPSIDFYNTKKSILEDVIKNFKDNINTMNQIISKVYIEDNNPWGSPYYSTAYAMFETLFIIKKYYKEDYESFKKLDITFKILKKTNTNDITKKLLNKFNTIKFSNNTIKNIDNVSDFLIKVKKLGYDMWFTIPLIFDTIYEKYKLDNIMESYTFGYDKIYFQKMNNKLGIMCYILVCEGFITNINIFQNFNI